MLVRIVKMDDVLSLFGDSEGETEKSFSGFSLSEEEETVELSKKGKQPAQKGKVAKVKKSVTGGKVSKQAKSSDNVVSVSSKKSSDKKSSDKKATKSSDSMPTNKVDLTSLTQEDIVELRNMLGLRTEEYPDAHDGPSGFSQRENIRVEIDADDISDSEVNFSNVLFGEEESENVSLDDWEMPKLKTPEKGKPVSDSLAKLINMACTAQCDTDNLLTNYKIPVNCETATPPLINQEVWKILDRKAHANDKVMVDIQNLVATGFSPVIKLAELIKGQISPEGKKLVSDILTILGQIQYNLSIRRRYMIRPCLKKKYTSLCQVSMPITTKLFGDDISKEIRNCDSLYSLGNTYGYQRGPYSRGRGIGYSQSGRFQRRGSYSYGSSNRYQPYQPYPQRGQQRGYSRPRPMKRAAATAPNEQE